MASASANPYHFPGTVNFQVSNPQNLEGKPFRQTHLGRLPPELRVMIFTELLATPPAFAGHHFATTSSDLRTSSPAPIKYIHFKKSWHQVLRTCRQIYHEALPLFFASKAYFYANCQEADAFLGYSIPALKRRLRMNTVTALCLSSLVKTMPLYSKEQLDEIFSNPNDPRRRFSTRQELEMQTFKNIGSSSIWYLDGLRNLTTIALCFRVGEEMLHVNMLYGLTGMRRGVVEFIDTSHWLIREQIQEDAWCLQYACFTLGDFNKGKDNEEISYDRREIETQVTDIDSRAPGLQEGDERYVEVSIRWPFGKNNNRTFVNILAQESSISGQDDRSSPDTYDDSDAVSSVGDYETHLQIQSVLDSLDESNIEASSGDSNEIQGRIFPDEAEENVSTENSDNNDITGEVQSSSNVSDGSPVLGLNGEDSRNSQETKATHQERDHTLSESSSEEVAGVQSEPMTSRDDQLSLSDTSDGHDEIQDTTDTNNNTAHAESSQHTEDFHCGHTAEIDRVQQNSSVSVGRPNHHNNGRIQPLPEISDAPNPYTEEEMESYERWQQVSMSRTHEQNATALHMEKEPSPSHEENIERLGQTSSITNTTKTPAKKTSTVASQQLPVWVVVTSFLLLLILALLKYLR